jgi:hypothetical protein
MGIKYIFLYIVDFINTKSDYYRSEVKIIKCSIIPPTLFFLPVYTGFSTQKFENMNFEEKNKGK